MPGLSCIGMCCNIVNPHPTSEGESILAAIAAEAHVRALIAEAAMDNGTRNWTTDEYQLMHAACVQMLTPPEGDDDYESQSDASIDIVEAEQSAKRRKYGWQWLRYMPRSILQATFRPSGARECVDYEADQTARRNSGHPMGGDSVSG